MNDLQVFLKHIYFYTDISTIQEIAEKVGYDRAYLNDQVNKGGNKGILKKLQDAFPEIQQKIVSGGGNTQQNVDGGLQSKLIASLEENNRFLKETIMKRVDDLETSLEKYILGLAVRSHSGIDAILESLNRLEKKPAGTLEKTADNKLVKKAGQVRKKSRTPARHR